MAQHPHVAARFTWLDPVTAIWSGDLDAAAVRSTAGRRAALMDPPQVLELSGVTWFGSAAMALLVRLSTRAGTTGGRILLRGAPVTVTRRLVMVGADDLFDWDRPRPGEARSPT